MKNSSARPKTPPHTSLENEHGHARPGEPALIPMNWGFGTGRRKSRCRKNNSGWESKSTSRENLTREKCRWTLVARTKWRNRNSDWRWEIQDLAEPTARDRSRARETQTRLRSSRWTEPKNNRTEWQRQEKSHQRRDRDHGASAEAANGPGATRSAMRGENRASAPCAGNENCWPGRNRADRALAGQENLCAGTQTETSPHRATNNSDRQ
jgi:hypothetical protein